MCSKCIPYSPPVVLIEALFDLCRCGAAVARLIQQLAEVPVNAHQQVLAEIDLIVPGVLEALISEDVRYGARIAFLQEFLIHQDFEHKSIKHRSTLGNAPVAKSLIQNIDRRLECVALVGA